MNQDSTQSPDASQGRDQAAIVEVTAIRAAIGTVRDSLVNEADKLSDPLTNFEDDHLVAIKNAVQALDSVLATLTAPRAAASAAIEAVLAESEPRTRVLYDDNGNEYGEIEEDTVTVAEVRAALMDPDDAAGTLGPVSGVTSVRGGPGE